MDLEEAAQLVKKPRMGLAEFPFKRPAWKAALQEDGPASKRPRVESHQAEQGIHFYHFLTMSLVSI